MGASRPVSSTAVQLKDARTKILFNREPDLKLMQLNHLEHTEHDVKCSGYSMIKLLSLLCIYLFCSTGNRLHK